MGQAGNSAVGTAGNPGSKLLLLELLRFACAMIVLVFHFQHFAMVGDGSGLQRDHEPLAAVLWPIYRYGSFGVEIFWAISGYIFYWKYADAIAARTVNARKFFWLRFSRLYPLHFVTLLGVAALQPVYAALTGHWLVYDNSLGNFILQLGMIDQWLGSSQMSFNGPIWSVSAEVFVYVLFFLLMRTFARKLWVMLGAVAIGLACLFAQASSVPLICAGYFYAGGAAADWTRCDRARRRPREARLIAGGAIGAATICLAAVADGEPTKVQLLVFVLAISTPLIFLAAQEAPWLERWQRPVQAAGDLTYATYLIHFPLQLAVATAAMALGLALPIADPWFLAAYVGAVLVLGRLVFQHFERPMQDFIRNAALAPQPGTALGVA